jgi:hypothetical protein
MGPVGRSKTSVRNYRYLLRKKLEERSSHLLHGGSLTSRMCVNVHNSFIGASPSQTSRHYCTQLSYHMSHKAYKTHVFRNFAAWLWKLKALFVYGCMFCILLFDYVSYVFLLLCLCIPVDKYALFCTLFANWHSPATLTEGFPCFFLQLQGKCQGIVNCVVQCIVCV